MATEGENNTASHIGHDALRAQHTTDKKRSPLRFVAIVIPLIILAVIGLLVLRNLGVFGKSGTAAPTSDLASLIPLEYNTSDIIASISFDPQLNITDTDAKELLSGKKLQPLENNWLAADKNGKPILADITAIRRVISFDEAWVSYAKSGDKAVFGSLAKKSPAQKKVEAKASDGTVAFHELSLGQMLVDERQDAYYLPARENVTLAQGATLVPATRVFIYKLVPKGHDFLIDDFIALK